MAERIAIGFVNFPAPEGNEEYDEPEVQPYLAVLERLQQRLVPFTNSKGVTLELFVEVPSGVMEVEAPSIEPQCAARMVPHVPGDRTAIWCNRCGEGTIAGLCRDKRTRGMADAFPRPAIWNTETTETRTPGVGIPVGGQQK